MSRLFPMQITKTALNSMALFHGVSREIHQTGSVPQCWKLLASSLFSCFCGISHESHQNGWVLGCYKWRILYAIFMIVHINFIKTAPYHHALRQFVHEIPHAFCHNSSVPRCYKKHMSSHFVAVFALKITKSAQYHDATNERFHRHFACYFCFFFPTKLIKTAQ